MPSYNLEFYASESLYEEGGALCGTGQPDHLVLGPVADYVQLTYRYLRCGPEADHIAAYDEETGCWRLGVATDQRDVVTVLKGADPNGMLFSDVSITAADPE